MQAYARGPTQPTITTATRMTHLRKFLTVRLQWVDIDYCKSSSSFSLRCISEPPCVHFIEVVNSRHTSGNLFQVAALRVLHWIYNGMSFPANNVQLAHMYQASNYPNDLPHRCFIWFPVSLFHVMFFVLELFFLSTSHHDSSTLKDGEITPESREYFDFDLISFFIATDIYFSSSDRS